MLPDCSFAPRRPTEDHDFACDHRDTASSPHGVRRINDSPHREGGLPGRAIEVQCRVLQEGGGSRPDYRLVGILSTPRANTHFKGFWDIDDSVHFRSG